MKKIILVQLFLFSFLFLVNAQKVDIDNRFIEVQYAQLPDNFTNPENRTYSAFVDGSINGSQGNLLNQIRVFGWTPADQSTSMVNATVILSSMLSGKASATSRTVENKDKDGKVTSRVTYHKVSATNQGTASLRIYGPVNSFEKYKSAQKDAEKQREKEEKAKEKAKKKGERPKVEEENPFLKSVSTTVSEVEEVTKLNDSGKSFAYNIDLSKNYVYSTDEFTTAIAANKEFNLNAEAKLIAHGNTFLQDVLNDVNHKLNYYYGFKPVRIKDKFKILDSKDHPENKNFNNAMQAVEVIFGKMRYNQSIDVIAKDIEPIIAYFDGITKKLQKSEDKHEKKLRAACYYNLGQIYYYLDQQDKVIEIGNKIIESKHDEDDGEDFIKKANKILDHLSFLNMKSRHIVPQNPSDEKEETVELTTTTP
ncbi:MAG: hypothetical protein KA767_09630 [Saprospiraceae bacterium]|nr:hypothetical protein [Saprospiraceae bacterium]